VWVANSPRPALCREIGSSFNGNSVPLTRISAGRIDRACAFLRASPPHGLALLESDDEIQLTSAPDCGPLVERFLDSPPPEPLSLAALEVLSIVAYEQPVTRADISHIRATDSSGVIETLLARGLVVDDPRFGGRGRPSFLVTTAAFLRLLGLGSLAELPPRPVQSNVV
jgi:segregation and condensation protein B